MTNVVYETVLPGRHQIGMVGGGGLEYPGGIIGLRIAVNHAPILHQKLHQRSRYDANILTFETPVSVDIRAGLVPQIRIAFEVKRRRYSVP